MNENKENIDHEFLRKIQRVGFSTYYARYSTFWDRLFANLIDGMVLNISALLIGFFLQPVYEVDIGNFGTKDIIEALLPYAYFVTCNGKFGRTVGKKVLGLKIIDQSEEREMNWIQAVARDSVPLVFTIVFIGFAAGGLNGNDSFVWAIGQFAIWWSIGEVVTSLMNEKRRAIHDYIARTVVVKL